MDAPGIREELRDMARRLATVGYCVLLPNLYYRAGRDTIYGPQVLEHGSAEHQRMRAVRTKMTIPPVMDDVAAMMAFVDAQAWRKRGRGRRARLLHERALRARRRRALSRPRRRRGLVLRHLAGQRRGREPAPVARQDQGRGATSPAPSIDELAPLPMVAELRALFEKAGAPASSSSIRASTTASPFPQRKVYDKPAAERHWERLIALYRRRLG